MFDVAISLNGNNFFCKLIVDSYFFEKNKYEYAFYLMRVGDKYKSDARWYEENMEANFGKNYAPGMYYIRCFIRDKEIRNTRIFDSQEMSIYT